MYQNPYIHKSAAKNYDYAFGTYSTEKPLFSLRPSESNITYTTKDGRVYRYDANNVAAWRNIKASKKELNKLLKSKKLTSDDISRIITGDPNYGKIHRQHLATVKDADWNKVMYPMTSKQRLAMKPYSPKYSSFYEASYNMAKDRVGTSIVGIGQSNPFKTKLSEETRFTNQADVLFNAMDEDTALASVLSHELNHAITMGDIGSRRAMHRQDKIKKAGMRNVVRGHELILNNMINPHRTKEGNAAVRETIQDAASSVADDMSTYVDITDDLLDRSKALDPYSFIGSERIQAVANNTQSLYAAQRLMQQQPELFKDFDMAAKKKFLSLKAPAKTRKQFIDRMEFFLEHPEFGLLLGEGSRLIPVYNEVKNLRTVMPKINRNQGKGFFKELFTPDQRFTDPSLVYEKRRGKNLDAEYNMLTDMYFY